MNFINFSCLIFVTKFPNTARSKCVPGGKMSYNPNLYTTNGLCELFVMNSLITTCMGYLQ